MYVGYNRQKEWVFMCIWETLSMSIYLCVRVRVTPKFVWKKCNVSVCVCERERERERERARQRLYVSLYSHCVCLTLFTYVCVWWICNCIHIWNIQLNDTNIWCTIYVDISFCTNQIKSKQCTNPLVWSKLNDLSLKLNYPILHSIQCRS